MNIFTKTVGFLAVLCAIEPCVAALRAGGATQSATSRISVATTSGTAAARRLPTLLKTATTTTDTTSGDSSLLGRDDCIEQYTECVKEADICGPNFEECTTAELFYAKKPQCNGVLLQCGAAGISALFGTSSLTDLSADNMYTYPTGGSLIGQYIEAGHLGNLYDTATCVKRVTSCLNKESVCGSEFELCTSNNEFKKQRVFCESNIARCQEDGIRELFGSTDASSIPTATSRLGILITEGAELAAANAVSTCYKVADQCILNACRANPYKCIQDSSTLLVDITDSVQQGMSLTDEQMSKFNEQLTKASVSSYIRGECKDTIGGSKYCYMTTNNGAIPTVSQLMDEDNRDDIYADIYASRMNVAMRAKIQDLADEFDRETKNKCADTIMACAMRSCGSGLGSACFKKVYGTANSTHDMSGSINDTNTYGEIQRGCEAIVNTDANCQYAAAKTNEYNYNDTSAFAMLFPKYTPKSDDPIAVVARLNAALAENYNDAAIAKLKQDCRNTAVSCIRSMCGADFVNCYRNRTDVMTDTYATDEEKFNQSMNKVGGVLDFTIVRGLCVNAVKEAKSCDEHLKLEAYSYNDDNNTSVWGGNDVRTAWVDAVKDGYSAKAVTIEGEYVETGNCTINMSNTLSPTCRAKVNVAQACNTIDEDGCVYDVEELVARVDYQLNMAADTLFQEVLGDLELEAQAQYNAKLTQEQNMCVAANNGGIMGRNDMSSTYMWVKLNSRKVPKNYSVNGLKANEFKASNDLYGSFCRARVTVQSDDADIQRYLQNNSKNWSNAYFAVGDVFTCGSWIPQADLEAIAIEVACKKAKAEGKMKANASCDGADSVGLTTGQKWATFASVIGSGALGGVGMDLLQTKTGLGGLLGTQKNTSSDARKLNDNLTAANSVFARSCGNSKDAGGYIREDFDAVVNGTVLYKYSAASATDNNSSCSKLFDYITILNGALGAEDGTWWNRDNNGRLVTDAVGATALAITGGLAVGKNIKAANRQQFTKDQQEFMNNVGNHIYCFIGADEAGTYGDLIEISLD